MATANKSNRISKINQFNPLNEPATGVKIKVTYLNKLKKLAILQGVSESRMLELLVMKATS